MTPHDTKRLDELIAHFSGLRGDFQEAAEYLRSYRALLAGDDGCICKGNWRAIVKESEPLIGKQFRHEREGKIYRFEGPVHGGDDYYYLMRRRGGSAMLSCVGSIEQHGYTLLSAAEPLAREP